MKIDYNFLKELAEESERQYEIEDVYGKLIAERISKDTDMYWEYVKYDQWTNSSLKITVLDKSGDYDEILKKIEQAIESSGGTDNAQFTNHVASYAGDWYSEDLDKGLFHYSNRVGDIWIYGLCEIFKFALTNQYPHNCAFGNKCEDNAKKYFKSLGYEGWGGGMIPYGETFDLGVACEEPMFEGISVKFFKNGKVQFKVKSDKFICLETLEKAIKCEHKY